MINFLTSSLPAFNSARWASIAIDPVPINIHSAFYLIVQIFEYSIGNIHIVSTASFTCVAHSNYDESTISIDLQTASTEIIVIRIFTNWLHIW